MQRYTRMYDLRLPDTVHRTLPGEVVTLHMGSHGDREWVEGGGLSGTLTKGLQSKVPRGWARPLEIHGGGDDSLSANECGSFCRIKRQIAFRQLIYDHHLLCREHVHLTFGPFLPTLPLLLLKMNSQWLDLSFFFFEVTESHLYFP